MIGAKLAICDNSHVAVDVRLKMGENDERMVGKQAEILAMKA